jgi:hypothetical protein
MLSDVRESPEFSPESSPALSSRFLRSYRLGDNRGHQAINADTLVLRLSRQFRIKRSRQTLAPLRRLNAGLRQLPARLSEYVQTMLILTARETEAFANAILSPAKPGPVLRKAARDYRQKTATG